MILKRALILALLFLLAISQIVAQVTPLKIGDALPDFNFRAVNLSPSSINIQEYRGEKAILFDFWATWCAPCVASFAKLDTLQRIFAKDLVILPVAYEDESTIKQFFLQLKRTKKIDGYSIVNDNYLSALFPHKTVPHYVLIDKAGIIRAIPYSENVNRENLLRLISNEPLSLTTKEIYQSKNVEIDKFSFPKPMDSTLLAYKIFSKYSPDLRGGAGWTANSVRLNNISILGMFQFAYGEGMRFFGSWGTTELTTSDSTMFTDDCESGRRSEEWRVMWSPAHRYVYMLKLDRNSKENPWEVCRRDLQTYFPWIDAKIVQEDRMSLVLSRTGESTAFIAKKDGSSVMENGKLKWRFHDVPLQSFLLNIKIAYQGSNLPLVNELNYDGNIDFEFEGEVSNLSTFNEGLRKYGLKLERVSRQIGVLSIKDMRRIDIPLSASN